MQPSLTIFICREKGENMRIKTKEALKDIKVFDRAKNLAQKSKSGFGELNREADETQGGSYSSGSEYASENLQFREKNIADGLIHGAEKAGNWGVRETRNIFRKRKALAAKRVQNEFGHTAYKAGKNGIKTTERTAKAAKKGAETTIKASKKTAEALKKTAEITVRTVKAAVKATVAAVKAAIAAIKELIALIAAGGWAAVLIIAIICAVGLIIGSVYAIFIPKDNGVSIQSVMRECEREQEEWIESLKASVPYDYCHLEGQGTDWKEVIAVWAVICKVDVEEPENLVALNEKTVEKLKVVYSTANQINAFAETRVRVITVEQQNEDGEVAEVKKEVQELHLIINRVSVGWRELAELNQLNQKQIKTLQELLDKKNHGLWTHIITQNYLLSFEI